MTELLLGCGFSRKKLLALPGEALEFADLVTLDNNEHCKPDLLCDLDGLPELDVWLAKPLTDRGDRALTDTSGLYSGPIAEKYFDEVHAYEVLEHLGSQGNATSFFACFRNIHRVLRPGGHLFATVPSRYSEWLWGDPSHRRAILPCTLVFLSQAIIKANRDAGTQMSDFSDLWDLDFRIVSSVDDQKYHRFCLQAIK